VVRSHTFTLPSTEQLATNFSLEERETDTHRREIKRERESRVRRGRVEGD
jgi:hypothetical protein